MSKIIIINIALIPKIRAVADVKIRMLRPFASATNLDMDIGIDSVAIVSNKEYVGVAIV